MGHLIGAAALKPCIIEAAKRSGMRSRSSVVQSYKESSFLDFRVQYNLKILFRLLLINIKNFVVDKDFGRTKMQTF